ncbi:MAG: molybdopterin molybdotransferase MoeA [Hyphomicrobiaceae bacterium]|nr:molybdopterin molybdotransferase MoeA [Hyphomicrobiaceae bacterium]
MTVEEALAHILDGVTPLSAEDVPLDAAHGRTLAADVVARLTQPPFAASAMDGYAVRAADVARLPARLTVIGEAAAGRSFSGPEVGAGEAVRIFTGAPIPAGTDAIVIQENTRPASTPSVIEVHAGRPEAEHIRPMGGDFKASETLLASGRILDARALILASASGHATLAVRRRPVVAIIPTGDELVQPGTTPGPDQIISSNPVGLAAMLRAFGAETICPGIARDHLDHVVEMMRAVAHADIVLTTGGASVGDHDLVRPALAELGVSLDFWKLAMRPGKPMLFGRVPGARSPARSYLGLPGNPVSAMVTARLFAVPLINALLGRDPAPLAAMDVPLARPLEKNGPRQHYMRAVLRTDAAGSSLVAALPNQDSSLLSPLALANALIVRPINAPSAPVGTPVPVIRLDF